MLDADGAPKDREEISIDVPDFASAALAIGSPAFFKARNGLELRQLRAAPDATPYAGKDFERTDHLLVRFSIVGSAAEGATITANLLSKRGASLATLAVRANRGSKRPVRNRSADWLDRARRVPDRDRRGARRRSRQDARVVPRGLAVFSPHTREVHDHLDRLLQILTRRPLQPRVEVVLAGKEIRRREAP